jgi:broad specificity phosphatase PhoE
MTKFLLIRHGAHLLGAETIAGRSPGVNLSPLGERQVAEMIDRVAHLPIRAVYSSPVDRTIQTARPLAERLGLQVQVRETLSEVDYGDWTRKRLEEVRPLDRWRQWNSFRSGHRIPGGESMLDIQSRIVGEMLRLRAEHPDDACLALVSHGDVIKAATAWFLGVPIDLFTRIEIGLASVTAIAIGDYGPWVLCVNNTSRIELPS